MNSKFENLGLSEEVLKSIDTLNYDKPSEIQEKMIPLIIDGIDLIGQAQTGTGKTLAYAASILSKVDVKTTVIKAIILTPTRELALQVCDEFKLLNKNSDFDIVAVYGGSSIENQIKALKNSDIVVGTPGRVMDLIRRGKLNIEHLEFFVLDEADEMLDMGFLEDIETIFKSTNQEKQVLMLSATMPKQIETLATKYMKKDYKHIEIKSDSKTAKNVKQYYYLINAKTRIEVLCRILDIKNSKRTIIFCQTKRECDELLMDLSVRGYNAEAMHGDITQSMRIKTLDRFKKGAFNCLIATDVAARGIHVDDIDVVINFNLPQDFETYVHRIGRTGRANNTGEAISLVTSKELKYLKEIEKFVNSDIIDTPLPTKEEIIKTKYENLIQEASNLKETNDYGSAIEYVRDLNKSDLINLSAALLKMTVEKQIGANLDKDIRYKEEKHKSVKDGRTRLFLNIGSKDKLKKGSLLDLIKNETNINKDNFKNIEVLSTFTFIDVSKQVVDEFSKKIQNKKFNGRTIRVEKANRQR